LTLVDTSVWIDHFRRPDGRLQQLLANEAVGVHPFIIGELALGNLRQRTQTLNYLGTLPRAKVAQDAEVHHILESQRLWGKGISWVDLHLLASAAISGWTLLTADHAVLHAALQLGVGYPVN
jgi:predicted nucleic acid-binding protein